MEIEPLRLHEPGVQRQRDAVLGVIDQGERTDRAGPHAEKFEQPVGASERQPVGSDHVGKRFQVDGAVFLRDDKKIFLPLVTKIQVLHMRSLHIAAKRLRILDRAKRRVFVDRKFDSGVTKRRHQGFWRCRKAVLEGGGGVHVADPWLIGLQ